MKRSIAPILLALAVSGCINTNADDGVDDVDAATLLLTGVYSCSIETIDGYAYCGGPVYRSDLSGQSLTMNVTQTGTSLQVGMWGLVMDGTVEPNGQVILQHRDETCYACGPDYPFVIDVTGTGGVRQITNINIHMWQNSIDECEKSYRGTCAAN